MSKTGLTVVYCPVRGIPEVKQINRNDDIRGLIGGWMEAVRIEAEGEIYILLCDEEGKLKNSEPNFFMENDVIVGDIVILSSKGEEFASLTESDIEKVTRWIKRQRKAKFCTKCKEIFYNHPAISRRDGSGICPDCGVAEALEDFINR